MPDVAPLAFIGSTELVLIVVVGLLLFGGELPKVLGDVARIWIRLKRSVNEFRRESGIDEAMRDIQRETTIRLEEPRWRRDMDHSVGPASGTEPTDAAVSPDDPVAPVTEPEPDPPPPAKS